MSKHDPSKRQRLKSFDFSGEGSAMHLVADFQGGPANGEPVIMTKATKDLTFELIAKAADVRVELSMEEFLSKFFGLWGDDAAKLASLLGYEYESEEERYEWEPFDERIESFNEKVTLLKTAWAKAPMQESEMLDVLNLQSSIEKSLIEAKEGSPAVVSEKVDKSLNQNITKNKETLMTDKVVETETISKAQFEEMSQMLQKATAAIAAQAAEHEVVSKALEAEKAARVEDKNKVLKSELKKAVSNISMLEDETKLAVEDFLFKARNIEGAEIVLKALIDVQGNVKKALTAEEGVETHVEAVDSEDEMDSLMKAVLALTPAK
jgi:hypothetical protein